MLYQCFYCGKSFNRKAGFYKKKPKRVHCSRACHYLDIKSKIAGKKCIVDGCENAQKRKGYCLLHYYRMWRTGKLTARTDLTIKDRIKANTSINQNGCHEWTGQFNSMGYPRMSVNGKLILLHRYVFQATTSQDIENKCVCHKCDNPKCINPEHLFIGTCRENMRDMVKKGRKPNRKLTDFDIEKIRELSKLRKDKILARMFNVSNSYIRCIACGHSRKELYVEKLSDRSDRNN